VVDSLPVSGDSLAEDSNGWPGDSAAGCSESNVRERFEIALRPSRAGTWRWDLRSGHVDWDAAMEELYAVAPSSFEGTYQAVGRRVHPDDRAGIYDAVDKAMKTHGLEYSTEHRIVLPDGSIRWVQTAARVIRDADGTPTELIGVEVDITDRHRLESERAVAVSAAFEAERALSSALRRLRLLVRVGELLDQPLGPQVGLRQIADLVVEILADWCVIDVFDGGQAHREAVAHRDPGGVKVASAARRRGPSPPPGASQGVPEPLFLPDVSSGRLDRTVPDSEHRQLLQDLRRPRSYLLLPLVVNAHQLGSMLLVTTEAWQLDAEDVQLAVDVAQRCAAVIDKARLITELARANKVLHELRSTSVLPGEPPSREEEVKRMAAVRRYDVLDTPADGTFDRITALAARVFRVPIAIVSIVGTDRIWFKSRHGLDVEQIERGPGLCSSAILQRQPWVVTDAAADPRTLVDPLVAGEFGLRFYAGVPLTTHDGHNLGILCVIDYQPREVTADEVATLTDLAGLTMDELEIRKAAREHRWAGVRPA